MTRSRASLTQLAKHVNFGNGISFLSFEALNHPPQSGGPRIKIHKKKKSVPQRLLEVYRDFRIECLFSGPQKRPAESCHVKSRQKLSERSFDTFRHFSRWAKIVKKCQKCFRQFSRGTSFPAQQAFWSIFLHS